MNSRMKEAIATVRFALLNPAALAAHDEARIALDRIEAELAGPSLRERLARVEQDRQAYRRAHGLDEWEVVSGPRDLQRFADALRHIDPVALDEDDKDK